MHHAPVRHRTVEIDGMRIFLREGGEQSAPVVLLPHGYPCSSYEFRNLIPALADRWHPLAPDFPGFGYSDTPDPSRFDYDFKAYADLNRFSRKRASITSSSISTTTARRSDCASPCACPSALPASLSRTAISTRMS